MHHSIWMVEWVTDGVHLGKNHTIRIWIDTTFRDHHKYTGAKVNSPRCRSASFVKSCIKSEILTYPLLGLFSTGVALMRTVELKMLDWTKHDVEWQLKGKFDAGRPVRLFSADLMLSWVTRNQDYLAVPITVENPTELYANWPSMAKKYGQISRWTEG